MVSASTEGEIDTAFVALAQGRVDALVVITDPLFNSRPDKLAALATRHALPAIYPYREFAAAGGLITYGGNLTGPWYLVGSYAGWILKGEKPADLPVQQSTKVELIINLKTAQAPWPHRSAHATRARRRGDRIRILFAAVHESGFGTKPTFGDVRALSAFGGKADKASRRPS